MRVFEIDVHHLPPSLPSMRPLRCLPWDSPQIFPTLKLIAYFIADTHANMHAYMFMHVKYINSICSVHFGFFLEYTVSRLAVLSLKGNVFNNSL